MLRSFSFVGGALTTLENDVVTDSQPIEKRYRGRLAPSPTGYLHVGHARTFWAAFERARAAEGSLVMRMEDLDPDRSRAEYADAALEDLHWLGMRWEEGPDVGGTFGPYVQSQRMNLYQAAFEKLRADGWIYPCRCSRKDLAAALSAPHEGAAQQDAEDEPIYPGTCRPGTCRAPLHGADFWRSEEADKESGANWRFRVPDGEAIEFVDENLGPQRFVAGVDFGDFVVQRRDGIAGYQLACVVDDGAMRITEVVRGADLLKSTARQVLLNRALGYADPRWFHCALVVDASGKRLAKRNDALSVRALRERGMTADDLLAGAFAMEPDPPRVANE